jgi:cellulose synthase operon protein C
MLAYYQGYLYVEYIAKKHGEEAIAKLLNAYRLGLETGDALRRSLDIDKAAFESGYREFLRSLVKGNPKPEKAISFADLEAANKKNPDDADIAARLAGEYLRRGKPAEAKKLTEAVLAKEKGHPVASLVMARLLQREKDVVSARTVLETAAKENPEDQRVLMALGRLYVELNELEKAATSFEALRKLGMPDTEVLEILAKLYSAGNKNQPLIEILKELADRNPDDLEPRLKLAKLHRDAGHLAEAEASAREALFVDVMNAEARGILLDVLRAQKKDKEAAQLEERYK